MANKKKNEHPLIANVRLNMKLECSLILFAIILIVVSFTGRNCSEFFYKELRPYYTGISIDNIINFFSIVIGIYIAVITILATSIIGVSKEILKHRQDKALIYIFIFGVIEDLLVVGVSIFLPSTWSPYYFILSVLMVMAIVSLVKYIRLLVLIFQANMEMMAKDIDHKEEYENRILDNIELIEHNTKKDIR